MQQQMFRNWNSYTIGQEKEGTKFVPPTTLSAQMSKKQLSLLTREQKMSSPSLVTHRIGNAEGSFDIVFP